jgi:hypothetical protein
MKFLDGHFRFYGLNLKWNVSVPFCPLGDAEALGSFYCSQILH